MKICITDLALNKIKYYTQICKTEISGLGYVEKQGQNFLIKDIYLVKQYNTSTTTELDGEHVAKLIEKLIADGKDPSNLKLWWHSHSNMDCFWSTTDNECINNLCLEGFLISIVTNKKNDYKMRLDIKSPIELTLENLPLEVIETPNYSLYEYCKKQVEELANV